MNSKELINNINSILEELSIFRKEGLYQSETICEQLEWIKDKLNGKDVIPKPNPFTMGLIATREFDMWGDKPDLARQINEIQKLAESFNELQ